jgi:hypothetical protein
MAAIRTGIIETENQFRQEDQPDGTLTFSICSNTLLLFYAVGVACGGSPPCSALTSPRFHLPSPTKVPVCCWRVSRASGWSWPMWATRAPCWGPTASGPPTNSHQGTTNSHPPSHNQSINQRRSGALCTQRETRPQIRSRAHCSRQDRTRLGLRPSGAWARGIRGAQ